MARIKYFSDSNIIIYIYGETFEKHHEKHVLVVKADEDCQYGFDGKPIKNSHKLRNKNDDKKVSEWILNHQNELLQAWEKINNGEKPEMID